MRGAHVPGGVHRSPIVPNAALSVVFAHRRPGDGQKKRIESDQEAVPRMLCHGSKTSGGQRRKLCSVQRLCEERLDKLYE